MKLFSWLNRKNVTDIPKTSPSASRMSYQTAMLQGQGARETQEDCAGTVNETDVYAIQKSGLFAVVADGMGGMADGALASTKAVAAMQTEFSGKGEEMDTGRWLVDAVHRTNETIHGLLQGMGGSTLVACYVHQEQLWFASVGDSFLYLHRNGELIRLNRSHTVSKRNQLAEILEGQPMTLWEEKDPQGPALTQFLGMASLSDIDCSIWPLRLQFGDTLLLCSDGVTGPLQEKELSRCLAQDSANEICEALRQTVLSKNDPNQDNFTALVIRCTH